MRIHGILFFLFTAYAAVSQTFTSTVNQAVPDNGTAISFSIEVSGLPDSIHTGFGLVQVCVNILHTWDSDMQVRLVSPDGSAFALFEGVGGDGDNFENCCLRGDAPDMIQGAVAPFTGTFRPSGAMGTVNNGQNPNGNWTLVLYDTYAFADQGFLQDWSLDFAPDAPGAFPFDFSPLPIVKINTGVLPIVNEPKVPANLRIIDHGPGQLNHYTDTDYAYEGNILVEYQGFTGVYMPKKNFDFDLLDTAGAEIDTVLLGMPAENDWILKSEYLDPTLMFNPVAYEFSRRMGQYAPRTRFCEVFVDGEYQGVYNLTEKPKRSKDRVDIAKLTEQDTTGDELTGGYIIEMNHNGVPGAWESAYLPINYASNQLPVQFKYVYPKSSVILPVQGAYIKAFVDSFEYRLHQPDFADPETGYRKWIDENSFLDFMFVNEFSTNYDSYGRSTFLFKEKITDGGKLKIGPPWNYDRAFCCPGPWVWEATHPAWPFPDWWHLMHQDTLFLQHRWCRWNDYRSDALQTQDFLTYIDSVQLVIEDAALRNFQRWPELGFVDFPGSVNYLRQFVTDRLQWMDEQIVPQGECVSAAVEYDGPVFSLYPNPAAQLLNIQTDQTTGRLAVRIFNITGQTVYRSVLHNQGVLQVDVQGWPKGVYTVEMREGDLRRYKKIAVH